MEKFLLDTKCINIPRLLLLKAKQLQLSSEETLILLYVLEMQDVGITNITPQVLMQYTTFNNKQLDDILSKLISKKFIVNNLGSIHTKNIEDSLMKQKIVEVSNEKSLINVFEDEFARGLSPMELETITSWVQENKYSEETIILALKEAVKSHVLSFRYIEGILHNWSKNGVKQRFSHQEDIEEKVATSNYEWWKND